MLAYPVLVLSDCSALARAPRRPEALPVAASVIEPHASRVVHATIHGRSILVKARPEQRRDNCGEGRWGWGLPAASVMRKRQDVRLQLDGEAGPGRCRAVHLARHKISVEQTYECSVRKAIARWQQRE